MTQGMKDDLTVCAITTREMNVGERKLARMERLLIAATWAYNRFGWYTFYRVEVAISFPLEAEISLAACSQTMGPRLSAKLIELSSYKCKFVHNHTAWEI